MLCSLPRRTVGCLYSYPRFSEGEGDIHFRGALPQRHHYRPPLRPEMRLGSDTWLLGKLGEAWQIFFFFLFCLFRPPEHREFPGQGSNPSRSCDLGPAGATGSFNLLCLARLRTCVLARRDAAEPLPHAGTPRPISYHQASIQEIKHSGSI